mgnify:CR=1 FL=1
MDRDKHSIVLRVARVSVVCDWCKTLCYFTQADLASKKHTYCSSACGKQGRSESLKRQHAARKHTVFLLCSSCKIPVELRRPSDAKRVNAYCSKLCSDQGRALHISLAMKGSEKARTNGRNNIHHLIAYIAQHRPWNHSDIGKNLSCEHCGNSFDTNPSKIREGKGKFCSRLCYDAYRHNPHRIEDQKAHGARRRARKAYAPINDLSAAQWREIQAAYAHRCAYCGKRAKGHLTQDHITPLIKGGNHTASNVLPACRSCNARKWTGPSPVPVQPLLLTIASRKL